MFLAILAIAALIFAIMEFWNVKRASAIAVLLLSILAVVAYLPPLRGLLG